MQIDYNGIKSFEQIFYYLKLQKSIPLLIEELQTKTYQLANDFFEKLKQAEDKEKVKKLSFSFYVLSRLPENYKNQEITSFEKQSEKIFVDYGVNFPKIKKGENEEEQEKDLNWYDERIEEIFSDLQKKEKGLIFETKNIAKEEFISLICKEVKEYQDRIEKKSEKAKLIFTKNEKLKDLATFSWHLNRLDQYLNCYNESFTKKEVNFYHLLSLKETFQIEKKKIDDGFDKLWKKIEVDLEHFTVPYFLDTLVKYFEILQKHVFKNITIKESLLQSIESFYLKEREKLQQMLFKESNESLLNQMKKLVKVAPLLQKKGDKKEAEKFILVFKKDSISIEASLSEEINLILRDHDE